MELNKIYQGDCPTTLKTFPDQSINCCVTSPPYWGLRDYGHDGQMGLEKTPEEYVAKMVELFREVRRVLRDDGTLWLNLGDSYFNSLPGSRDPDRWPKQSRNDHNPKNRSLKSDTLKQKDLVGIPWMVAFALRADGWYLRQDIIWHKPNPMPESVTDRCTKSHEYIFLLSKSAKYYFNNEAIRERSVSEGSVHVHKDGNKTSLMKDDPLYATKPQRSMVTGEFRNRRSVWSISTAMFPGAHFATFPEDLILPCILAGCPQGGVVLDPFMGAGTTALVAKKNGCQYIGCELNPDYIEIANKRLSQEYLFT